MIKTIGILGGGQLGRMMAIAARQMGYKIVVLDPTHNSPCGQVADKEIIAEFDSSQAAIRLLELSDIVTYEFENVNLNVAELLESKLPQTSRLLEITQNRIKEKECIRNAGLQTVDYEIITNEAELNLFIENYKQNPAKKVIKIAQGGYDGKGQFVINNENDLTAFVEESYNSTISYIAEAFIQFEKELSVIICRNQRGATAVFPMAENIHHNQILKQSIVPARVAVAIEADAKALAERLATDLNLVGTLAIELFLSNGKLIVNELAPRPHNSGHYTLNACLTSQFEQHIRAICNLPLGDTKLLSPCIMLNILGEDLPLIDVEKIGKHKLHLYGKSEARKGRKMGHINVLGNSVEACLVEIDNLIG